MDGKLQQAIAAARAGQSKEAQVLLTQVLKENPKEINAWFLLSHLVDSKTKQAAYLEKVLAIDPGHEKAAARLAELSGQKTAPSPRTPAEPEPVQAEEGEFELGEAELTEVEPKTVEPELALELVNEEVADANIEEPAAAQLEESEIATPEGTEAIQEDAVPAETVEMAEQEFDEALAATLIAPAPAEANDQPPAKPAPGKPEVRPEPSQDVFSGQLRIVNVALGVLAVLAVIVLYLLISSIF